MPNHTARHVYGGGTEEKNISSGRGTKRTALEDKPSLPPAMSRYLKKTCVDGNALQRNFHLYEHWAVRPQTLAARSTHEDLDLGLHPTICDGFKINIARFYSYYCNFRTDGSVGAEELLVFRVEPRYVALGGNSIRWRIVAENEKFPMVYPEISEVELKSPCPFWAWVITITCPVFSLVWYK